MNISAIQTALKDYGIDGWLFYYFHGNDSLALRILGLDAAHFYSRRWFYFVPLKGTPVKLVHRIEMDVLDSLAGDKVVYLGWRELEAKLIEILKGRGKVAMQYSPDNAIPYISRVDAGMVELIQSCGVEVVSSGDLIQLFEAVWTSSQLQSHKIAAAALRAIIFEAFAEIKRQIESDNSIDEYEIQQFIWSAYDRYGLVSKTPPIVAVNEHSGSPHYQPTIEQRSPIKKGDFVLLDIWAKCKEPHDAVYADITWTGFVGDTVPSKYTEIFNVVAGARDAAVEYVKESIASARNICGWQVDDIARNFITSKGFGEYFLHRTGHSIGVEVHANGANIDNLETKDERHLIPRTCFSIEPGIYLSDFGVRSEIDVYIDSDQVLIAGQPIQDKIIPILLN